MFAKIIKYKKEARAAGKSPGIIDSIDAFIMWGEEQKYKKEQDKEQIRLDASTDLDKLIAMDTDVFAQILNIKMDTAEAILLLLEAEKPEIVNAATFDDFFLLIPDEDETDNNDVGC